MGKLIEFLSRGQQTPLPDIAIIRHAEKYGINGDISALGRRNALSKGLDFAQSLAHEPRTVVIEDANVERIYHTADNVALPLEESGIRIERSQKPELSRDTIFLDPHTSELRRKIYQTLGISAEENDRAMGTLLLEWMDKGEMGYGMADGTVSFSEARRVHAYHLLDAFTKVRERYTSSGESQMTLKFTHEIQAFIIATFGYKKDRLGRIVKSGADIVRERMGITKNLSGPAFYYDAKQDAFSMKLPRLNRHVRIHSYETFSVDEELLRRLASEVQAIPEAVTDTIYDDNPSLLIRSMRRRIAMGYPLQPAVTEESLLAA